MKVENEMALPITKSVTVMLLEPYAGKLARTVLRGESSRKGADPLDLFEIDETEKCLVDCFESPRQLNSVYKEMKDSMSVEEIEKSVDDLLQYKLLDYCIV